MLSAVCFNDHLGLKTDEIGDVRPERYLAPEFVAGETVGAQIVPETAFSIRGLLAEFAGAGE
jgi:hypothetical protein